MSTINTKQAGASIVLAQFGGIDRRGQIADLENLRPGLDGGLVRRCGYALRLTLGAAIRGVWSGSFMGEETVFAAAGNGLYRLDLAAGQSTQIGTIATGTSRVALFLWRGRLCCIDGEEIYFWDGSTLATASPYVPLIARERDPVDVQQTEEPINLLTRRARFTFRSVGGPRFFFTYGVVAVNRVFNVTGQYPYLESEYSLNTDNYGNQFLYLYQSPDAGDIIFVAVTLDEKYLDTARIAACTSAAVWGGSYDDRILCWGGGAASEMFSSRPVSTAQIDEARLWGEESGELYFPRDGNFHVGDGQYPLRAVCRHDDRLLIFTAGDAWEANFATSGAELMPVLPVNSGVGCSALHGAVQAGNDPLTVADGAVWRWSTRAQRRDECSAESISAGLSPFSPGFSASAIVCGCRARREVWFADPTESGGVVYIYHTGLDAWYRFTGIALDGLFVHGGEVGFWRGSSFYCFDETRESDLDTDGERPIAARLVLDGLDFGSTERIDHLTRIGLHLDGFYPDLTLTTKTDRGRIKSCTIDGGGVPDFRTFRARPLHTGRFRRLKLTITAASTTRLHLCDLRMTAEPGER